MEKVDRVVCVVVVVRRCNRLLDMLLNFGVFNAVFY